MPPWLVSNERTKCPLDDVLFQSAAQSRWPDGTSFHLADIPSGGKPVVTVVAPYTSFRDSLGRPAGARTRLLVRRILPGDPCPHPPAARNFPAGNSAWPLWAYRRLFDCRPGGTLGWITGKSQDAPACSRKGNIPWESGFFPRLLRIGSILPYDSSIAKINLKNLKKV